MKQMESCGCVTQKSSLKKGTLVTVNSSRKAEERLCAVCTVHHSDLLTSFLILSSKTVGI